MNKKVFGWLFLLIGALLILNSFKGITGFVIVEEVDNNADSILGIGLFILGSFILASEGRKNREEGLVKHIEKTRSFDRAIKRHDPGEIQRAIEKIGTGLGHEEKLKRDPRYWSIKTSKGGRIVYERPSGGDKVVLVDYLLDHEYHRKYG